MWLQILDKTKKLLGITDNDKDETLLLLIEIAVTQIEEYIHSNDIVGLDPIIAQLVAHNYKSGETTITEEGSSTSGGITPQLGEIKSVSYPEGVSVSYTTSADFVGKTSSSSKVSTAENTYFMSEIAPYLKSRRRVRNIRPLKGYNADETI